MGGEVPVGEWNEPWGILYHIIL